MQESFWWWQCSDRYIISLFPHLHTPLPPSLISLMVSVDFNPFTAVLAAQSLPIEVPSLKTLRLFPLFAWAREMTSNKMHSIGSRAVIGPSNMLFASLYVCTFQPGKIYAVCKLVCMHISARNIYAVCKLVCMHISAGKIYAVCKLVCMHISAGQFMLFASLYVCTFQPGKCTSWGS